MSKNFKKLKKSRSRTLVPSAVSIEGSASSNPVIQDEGHIPTIESRSREVTPPNTQETLSPSAYNTPESVHPGSEGEPSPEDALLQTPSSIDERISTLVPLTSQAAPDVPAGITGSDPTRGIYKGTTLNNADHFITIHDDSMETAPDVRPYFWKLGQWQKGHTDINIPRELKDRVVYDNELVREGRELLKLARLEGRGYFLNEQRYLLDNNRPGDTWYCMPAAGVIETMSHKSSESPAQADEGHFYHINNLDEFAGVAVLTNIRAPHIFADYERFPPGTAPWDAGVFSLYSLSFFVRLAQGGQEPWEIVWDQVLDEHSCTDYDAMTAMLHQHWPLPPPSPSTLPYGDDLPSDGKGGKWWSWLS